MPSCDKTTCSQPADVLVRYAAGGDTRTYCQPHYEDLLELRGLKIAEAREIDGGG